MKKITAILLAVFIAFSAASCSAQTRPGSHQITLTLWSIATESDNYHHPYLDAIADFEAAHPDIKIDLETFENETYKTKLKSAMASNELPDIFFTWGGGFSQPFVEAGRVLCVDEPYQNYKTELPEVMLTNLTFDGKKYGSVYTMNVSMLFYNKVMFDWYHLKPPATFDELKTVCKTFIANGITPFGISARDIWSLAMIHDQLTLKTAGAAAVKSVLTKDGTRSYDSPDFLTASSHFAELVNMGAFSKDAVMLTNDEATQTFYDGKVPMYITGSWMVSDFYLKSDMPDDFDCVPVPVVNNVNAAASDFMGGPSDSLMVSASTKYPEEAATAMFELSKNISKYAYLSGSGVAAWNVDYDAGAVKPLTRKIAGLVHNATSLTLWFDTLMQSENAGVYLDNLQQLYLGNITPQQFTEVMAAQLGG